MGTVTEFLDAQKHPLRDVIDHLRDIIHSARPDLIENIKWNGPNFTDNGEDRITIKIHPPRSIQVIFHCGAKASVRRGSRLISDDLGILVWRGNDRAIATFKDLAEARCRSKGLQKIVRDWVEAARAL
jgi:hypothetical protein